MADDHAAELAQQVDRVAQVADDVAVGGVGEVLEAFEVGAVEPGQHGGRQVVVDRLAAALDAHLRLAAGDVAQQRRGLTQVLAHGARRQRAVPTRALALEDDRDHQAGQFVLGHVLEEAGEEQLGDRQLETGQPGGHVALGRQAVAIDIAQLAQQLEPAADLAALMAAEAVDLGRQLAAAGLVAVDLGLPGEALAEVAAALAFALGQARFEPLDLRVMAGQGALELLARGAAAVARLQPLALAGGAVLGADEVVAQGQVAGDARGRVLETVDRRQLGRVVRGQLGLDLADAVEVLVVAEAALADGVDLLAKLGVEAEHRGVAEVELAGRRLDVAGQDAADLGDVEQRRVEPGVDVADLVDAAAAGAAGHLLVLAGQQVAGVDAVVLFQALENDRRGGHVDAHGEGLGGEQELEQAGGEDALDDLLEDRQDARVVEADAVAQQLANALGAGVAGQLKLRDEGVEQPEDLLAFVLVEQVAVAVATRVVLASQPREAEVQRRQPVHMVQVRDDVARARRVALARAQDAAHLVGPQAALELECAVADAPEVFQRRLADARQPDVMLEGHRPLVFLDHRHGQPLAHAGDPGGKLGHVRHGCRKANEADMLRREEQTFFPHRAALNVVDEVDLVEDDVLHIIEPSGILEDRVAEDLRGHDQHGGERVEVDVASNDADLVAPGIGEVTELLVAESFDRAGVNDPSLLAQILLDRVFGNDGLARARGGGDDHGVVPFDGLDRLDLEIVELETVKDQHNTPGNLL